MRVSCHVRALIRSIGCPSAPRDRPHPGCALPLLAVAHALLDRILRQQHTTIPCPLRDLILDSGVRDRRTVSQALRWLHDAGFGTYNEVFDPASPESS